MIKWKSKDVMDERGIKSKDLAKEMGITLNLITNLRRPDMPLIDGDINKLWNRLIG